MTNKLSVSVYLSVNSHTTEINLALNKPGNSSSAWDNRAYASWMVDGNKNTNFFQFSCACTDPAGQCKF